VFDVVVVGSTNLDLVATTARLPRAGETVLGSTFTEHPGGKGLNQAVAAARCGARVAFVGAVGDDEAGERLRSVASDEGIDVTGLVVVNGSPTGRALITVDAVAENSIVVVPGANAHVTIGRIPAAAVVLAQLEVPVAQVETALRIAREQGSRTVLNPAPAQDLPASLLAVSDVVVPNEHELGLVGGVDGLSAAGVSTVVTTRGAAGVAVVAPDGTWNQPPYLVDAVDTTAAGDAFCGALAARLADGGTVRDAVRFAAAAGALATTVRGAVPSLPRRVAVEELMRRTQG
jgi:ribokinase